MLGLAVAPTLLVAAHALSPFLPIPRHLDPTARLHGWRDGGEPRRAPGVGVYGPAAERCIYLGSCDDIRRHFEALHSNL